MQSFEKVVPRVSRQGRRLRRRKARIERVVEGGGAGGRWRGRGCRGWGLGRPRGEEGSTVTHWQPEDTAVSL